MRKIRGYSNYFITREGDVYNNRGYKMRPGRDRHGNMRITLTQNGYKNSHLIHSLVADAFMDNPGKYVAIRHINGDKADNRVKNLEWKRHAGEA